MKRLLLFLFLYACADMPTDPADFQPPIEYSVWWEELIICNLSEYGGDHWGPFTRIEWRWGDRSEWRAPHTITLRPVDQGDEIVVKTLLAQDLSLSRRVADRLLPCIRQ